jgi:hypothetical protein
MAASDDYEEDSYSGFVVHTTERAILFYLDDLEEEVWLPKSHIGLNAAENRVYIPKWLARDRGLL